MDADMLHAYLPHWLNVNGINFSKFGRAEVECSVFMLHILLEGNLKGLKMQPVTKGQHQKRKEEWSGTTNIYKKCF
jgi:hypothetical protein